MPIRFDSDAGYIIESFEKKSAILVDAVATKMTELMTRLQTKIRGRIHSQSGHLAESIANPRATVQGTNVIGELDAGENIPYAKAVEAGAKAHIVRPLTKAGIRMYLSPKGQWRRGHHKGAVVRKGGQALQFIARSGEELYRQQAQVPEMAGQFYIRDSVQEMREQMISEIEATIRGVIYGE